MSILIKGMEMPKSCNYCNFQCFVKWGGDSPYANEIAAKCLVTDKFAFPSDSERDENCPLIEQKTGKWIDKWYCSNMSGYEYAMNCSECGKPTYRISFAEPMPNYCPNCGARMVEE